MSKSVEKFRRWLAGVRPNAWLAAMAVFAAVIFLPGLNERQLWGADEPRIAGIATEMAIYGNWIQPRLNGTPFLETPPLFFWLDAISIKAFGQTDFAAKLPAALAAVAGVIALFMLVRNMGCSGFTALVCGGMLATSAQYWNNGRKCMTDILLCAFIMWAMMAFQRLTAVEGFRQQKKWFLWFALFLGGALLSKSLIGLAIPASALFCWLLLDNLYVRRKFTFSNWLYLFAGSALALFPLAAWLWLLYCAHGYDTVHTVVWTNNVGRFFGSHNEHVEPFFYYLKKLPEQFQPWTALLPFALVYHLARLKRERCRNSLLMLCWLLVPFVLLSIAAGKRQVYLLPLYAPEAMLAGTLLAAVVEGTLKLPARINVNLIIRFSAAVMAGLVCVSPLAIFIAARILKQPVFASDNLMLCLLAAVGLILFGLFGRYGRHPELIAAGIFFGMAINYVAVDAMIFKSRNPRYSLEPVFSAARHETADRKNQLYLYCPSERVSGGAVFYLGRRVPTVGSAEALEKIRSGPEVGSALFLADKKTVAGVKNLAFIYERKVKNYDMVLFKFNGVK